MSAEEGLDEDVIGDAQGEEEPDIPDEAADGEVSPASPEQRPASPEQRPAMSDQRPASPAERPAAPVERPASAPSQRPASPDPAVHPTRTGPALPPDASRSVLERVLDGMSKERQAEVRTLRDSLGLRDDDSLLAIIGALEYYRDLYARIPIYIKDASNAAVIRAREQGVVEVRKAIAGAAESIMDTVGAVLKDRQAAQGRKSMMSGLGFYSAGASIFGGLCVSIGYAIGAGHPPPWLGTGVVQTVLRAPIAPVAGLAMMVPSVMAIQDGAREHRTGLIFGGIAGVLFGVVLIALAI